MNDIFLNSRGLYDLAKHLHIVLSAREHNLDFIAISKTGTSEFSQSLLDCLSGGIEFVWNSHPSRGRSGGILLSVRADTMDILACSKGEFHIKLHIRNKAHNFTWSLVAM